MLKRSVENELDVSGNCHHGKELSHPENNNGPQ
jgi:hypothetical protein